MIPTPTNSHPPAFLQPATPLPQPILRRIYNAVTNFFKELAGKIFAFLTTISSKLKECFTAKKITAQPGPILSQTQSAQPATPPPPVRSTAKPILRVSLLASSQSDMQEQLPAGAFHAVCAIKEISENLPQILGWLNTNNTQALSQFQRDIILNHGIPLYKQALQQNGGVQERADFAHLSPYFPNGVSLHQPYYPNLPQPFKTRLAALLDWLTSQQKMAAWVKSGNGESFAIVATEDQAIIFDSHKNEMIGTYSREQLTQVLREKLEPFANGIDENPFHYAVSN